MYQNQQQKSLKKNSKSQNHDPYNGGAEGLNKMQVDKKLKQKKNAPFEDDSQNVSFKAISVKPKTSFMKVL